MPTVAAFIGGCITLFFCCIVSSAAGIGGGGINVPVLLLIFGYSFETCVTLSLCIVLGNALAQSLINVSRRHPVDDRYPLIFWELIIILLPAQMGGSNIGSILSTMFPASLMYILAFLVLCFAGVVSLRKGLHKYHDETLALVKAKDNFKVDHKDLSSSNTFNPVIRAGGPTSLNGDDGSSKSGGAKSSLPLMRLPLNVLVVMAAMWVAYTSLMIGLVLVTKCSSAYIALFVCMYVPLMASIFYGVQHNVSVHSKSNPVLESLLSPAEQRKIATYDMPATSSSISSHDLEGNPSLHSDGHVCPNDFDFRSHSLTLAPVAFVIGVICTLLGVGGGELYGPLMLTYHVMPQVSSATTSMMSLLNTTPAVIRYLVKGEIDLAVGGILFLVGLTGGYVGRHTGLYISSRYGRPSVIVFALTAVLALSAVYYVYQLSASDFDSSVASYC